MSEEQKTFKWGDDMTLWGKVSAGIIVFCWTTGTTILLIELIKRTAQGSCKPTTGD